MTTRKKLTGVVSTLFAQVHRPTKIEMDILGEYSVLAADHLNAMIVDGTLAAHAKRMNEKLYAGLRAA